LYSIIGAGNSTKPEDLAKLKEKVRSVISIAKEYGATDVYFYGIDEATGDRLRSQRESWKAVHEAGGKVFVAGYGDIFDSMGDLLDLCVYAFQPILSEAGKWHSAGHKIWCYANPQAGIEDPAIYRRNYGLPLWQKDYDGACTFAYMANYGNIWNDYDGMLKDENMVYPTVNGVVDTLHWEGYREGVDDVRYITTLQHDLNEAKKDAKAGKQKEAIAAADKFIRELKSRDLKSEDPSALRKEIIGHILALKG
jgi:hypothetical protein